MSATVTVTFPTGFFADIPSGVSTSTNDPRISASISGLTKDGFSLRGFNYTSAQSNASPTVWWVAVA
ncbi:hypothetical protein [Arthrobacter sp. BF1]|uniref:hypothetical protein n=1 Tax=Arthrobacter sp. BF1 TaxID=2821145 RepID=UPI001C501612|nr:hypothetical protein [Arthrobacter sp. BF1]